MRSLIAIIMLTISLPAWGNSLQDMIDAAAPGATIEVPSGTYGPIKTDKPIQLIGKNWPIIDGGGLSDCVVLVGNDSHISGFIVRNSGDDLDHESTGLRVMGAKVTIENNRFENVLFGIDLKSAPDCIVRNNYIGSKALDIARRGDALRLFRSDNCQIESNIFENGRDALLWYSNHVTVKKNISRHNRYGFHMMYANQVTLEDNLITDNSVGIYLMYGHDFVIQNNQISHNRGPSGYGIGIKEVDKYSINNNVLNGNRVGIYIDGSPLRRKPGSASIKDNAIAYNDIGLTLFPSVKGNRVSNNLMADNLEQVAVLGRGAIAGNDFSSNYWSDYIGYDANRDGIGDQPYAAKKLFENLTDKEPKLKLFQFSPAQLTIDFVGSALPAVSPEAKFTDSSPMARAPELKLPLPSNINRHSNLIAALVLLGVPALIMLLLASSQWLTKFRNTSFHSEHGVHHDPA